MKKDKLITIIIILFLVFTTIITLIKTDLPGKIFKLKANTSYVIRTATFNSTGLDYLQYSTATCNDYGSGCSITLPRFNKKGYFSTWWSTKSLPSQNLKGYEWSWDYFYPSGFSYTIKSNVTFYPNFNHFHYDWDDNEYKFRNFSINKDFTIGNTLFEFQNGIPIESINKMIDFIYEAYSLVPWEFTPTKSFIMTNSTYNDYSYAYGLTHNTYSDSTTTYESFQTIDLQDDRDEKMSQNALLHELAHTWDSYYKHLTGKFLNEQPDIVSLFNSMKARGIIKNAYLNADNNASNVEWFAGMVTNYYWHILGKDDSHEYYALNGPMTNDEKNIWKNIIEKYGPSSYTKYPTWDIQTYAIKYDGNNGKYYCEADKNYYSIYESEYPSKYCSTYSSNTPMTFVYGHQYIGEGAIVCTNTLVNGNQWYVRDGYKFTGWNTKAMGNGDSFWSPGFPSKNRVLWSWKNGQYGLNNNIVTLYAQWAPIEYTVKFNSNTGEGTMNDLNMKYDIKVNISKNSFIKDGYEFTGWNSKPDGTGDISINDEESIINLTNVDGEIITLYAQWEIFYTISYNLSGGEETTNPTNYTIETNDITLANPKKDGYVFMGWIGSNGDEPEKDVVIRNGSTGNKNYTAIFKKDITALDISIVNLEYLKTEEEINQNLVIKDKDYTLKLNYDYYVFLKNVSETSKTILIKGISDYTNEKKITYQIKEREIDISKLDIRDNKNIIINKTKLLDIKELIGSNNIFLRDINNIEKNDNSNIATNDRLIIDDKIYDIAVLGDTTGDGLITISDVGKTYRMYRKKLSYTNLEFLASDVTGDNKITISDVGKIYRLYREK